MERSKLARTVQWAAPMRGPLLVPLVTALIGCQGFVGDPPARPGQDDGDFPEGVVLPAPQTRAPRLTHDEWERTVQELLHLDGETGLLESLRADALPGEAVFRNPGASLSVDDVLWAGYQRAATTLAERVTSDPTSLAEIAPYPADEAGATEFVRDMGLRAHRRPLDDVEVEEYLTLYRRADGLYGALDAHTAGIRLVLEAMLQSPFFLYRIELSHERKDGVIPLNDYEIAARLAYTLWGSMPDEELFAAAAAGMLKDPESLAMQAQRMLEDERAEERVVDFHRQLFDVQSFAGIAPSPEAFPDASPRLGEYATAEHDLFVREMVFNRDGTYGDLLTSSTTFVNDELARIYGLSGSFGEELVPVTLDTARRRGVFTQVGFLAANSTTVLPDPIHRGAFLAERIACIHIAAPPANTPPPAVVPGQTNRETIAEHTEQPGSICAGCHAQIINPFGFAFEHYDAIGGWRSDDSGLPVDASARPPVDGTPTPVSGAPELADALADSQWAHECYARHWIEFAFGRHTLPEDQALIAKLADPSRAGELAVRDMLVAIVTSRAFVARSTRESTP